MSGIDQNIVYHATRLRSTFADGTGHPRTITGSGFVVVQPDFLMFVTNKHNLDPCLKLGNDTTFTVKKVEVEFREELSSGWGDKTKFFEILDLAKSIYYSPDADVAIIKISESNIQNYEPSYKLAALEEKELAKDDFFSSNLSVMDAASFIGFAGGRESQWWDTKRSLAISRTAHISSIPSFPFENKEIPTANVCLVSGLSFSGSSGSMVLSHAKGTKNLSIGGSQKYVEPKVIGIMSGHWKDTEGEMFAHSGLSYFTRSTSIIGLIRTVKASVWEGR
jgi:hypothetical protein